MMSGPKCYHYHVDEAALRAQREAARLAAEEARLAATLTRFQQDCSAAIAQFGSAIGDPPDLGAPGNTSKSQGEFERRLTTARATLDERVRAEQQAAMLAALAVAMSGDHPPPAEVDGEAALARVLARVRDQRGAGGSTMAPDELAAAVSRNLARLPAGATGAECQEVKAAAEELLSHAGEPYAEMRLDGLRAAVLGVERAVAERAVREHAVEVALGRLSALESAEARNLIAVVERSGAGRGPLPADLGARVAELEALAATTEERAYVGDVLSITLAELGYEVGPTFESSLDAAGFADVAVPSWRGYGVRVRSASAGGRLTFNVVRGEGDVNPQRDAEVEHAWCDALPEIVQRLARAGIEAERVSAVEAGAQPVQVDPSLPALPATGRARSGRPRELPVDGR
jgi:hypothetical protein